MSLSCLLHTIRRTSLLCISAAHLSMSVTSGRVEVNGVNLHYRRTGHGDHALLLMPGVLGSSLTDFDAQLEKLNKNNFTIIAWDPRGYGLSIPPNRDYPLNFLERDAKDGVDLMQSLQFKKFSLLGWSTGGVAALIAAGTYPSFIHKLVVLGAFSYLSEEDIQIYNSIKDVGNWSSSLMQPLEAMYGREYLAKTFADGVDTMNQLFQKCNGNICKHLLPQINCPTLIIHGGKDPVVPAFHSDYLHKHIRNSRLYLIPEGKHNIHQKYAEEFNSLVEDFLQSS